MQLRLNAIKGLTVNPFIGIIIIGVALMLSVAACSSDDEDSEPAQTTQSQTSPAPPAAPSDKPPIEVVTTSNIVADWVENVGGDGVEVFSLLPIGGDPHTFQPGARDVARITDADVVLSIGLGMEGGWLHDLLENAAADPESIVETGEIVDPIEFAEGHADEVELLEEISHVVHEVEDGEIDAMKGLKEIEELLEAAEEGHHHEGEEEEKKDEDHEGEEEEDEGHHHEDEEEHHHEGEEELPAMVMEIIEQVETGDLKAEDAIEAIEGLTEEGEHDHADHGHGLEDPHYWFDPVRVKLVVNDIAARLSVLDPDRGDMFWANATAYNAKLDELHSWTEQQVSAVPEENRLLVTSHDSFGYFANLYGFEVIGVVLSITTDVEPSAGDLADLVEEVKEEGVPVVFGETTVSERLASAVAKESGAELVRLYSGSLGPDGSGAETYIGMIRTNVERIVEGLK
ncbi:MAG: zinc ABC transporter substrate-binding protein [Dehalococcoidia bacterium]|nr:zinc ABC transporter substrate-binding protein [Dehalococcoidia bacterium]